MLAVSSPAAAGEPPIGPTQTAQTDLHLSLAAFIGQVHDRNERIHFQKLEWDISQDAVANAKAIFEPQLVASYLHDYSHIPKTVEDYSSLGFLDSDSDTYTKRNNEYNTAAEGLLPTGAQIRIGYQLKELQSSLLDAASTDAQYQTFVGASLVQPLLKNAGSDVTRANIRVAEADAAMAFQGYRREMLQVVSEAASAYWNLCLAQEKVAARVESVRIAEAVLQDNQERVRTGKMAETEVIEAEAGLALRKALEVAARQEQMAAINAVKTLLSLPAVEMAGSVVATDPLTPREITTDFVSAYATSLKTRPEYLSVLHKIEREGIRLAYAENQRWPQLDLKASYGLNGLDNDTPVDSWDMASGGDYLSYSVGFELRVPIMGGEKVKSELAAAKRRKEQTLLELKATETALANAADTSIRNVRSAIAQAEGYQKAVRFNQQLLAVEMDRLEAGMSNSRMVLDRDEELNRAREAYLESLVNLEKAEIALEAVKGTLLQKYGIDIAEAS
jgi:outer membrane protein TolC